MNGEEQILERWSRIEAKLERLANMEEQLVPIAKSWDSMRDLSRDLSLLMEPSTKLLTEELAEVETGFQLEDALFLLKRVLLSSSTWLGPWSSWKTWWTGGRFAEKADALAADLKGKLNIAKMDLVRISPA